jgi:site-specific DNA recombinase
MMSNDPFTPRRFAFMARVSSKEQAERENIDAQVREARVYFERNGIDPDTEVYYFLDDAISGNMNIWERPAGMELRQYVEAGRIEEAVVAWRINRVNRLDVISYFMLEGLCEDYGLALRTIHENVDTQKPGGQIAGGIYALMAREERRGMMADIVKGRRDKAARGRWQGGTIPPYGHRRRSDFQLEIDPVPAAIILEARDKLVHQGYSMSAVCKALEAEGVPTAKGGTRWHVTALRKILSNPSLYGEARYFTTQEVRRRDKRVQIPRPPEEHIIVPCPPIMTRGEWEELQTWMTRNSSEYGPNGNFEQRTIFATVLCAVCGSRYYPVEKTHRAHTYIRFQHAWHKPEQRACVQRSKTYMVADIDVRVWAQVRAVILDPASWRESVLSVDTRQQSAAHRVAVARRGVEDAEKAIQRLDSLVTLHINKAMPLPGNYEELMYSTRQTLAAAHAKLQEAERQATHAANRTGRIDNLVSLAHRFKPLLDHATFEDRRRLCRAMIDRVELDHTLPALLRVQWLVN